VNCVNLNYFEVIAAWKLLLFFSLAPRELLLANSSKSKLKVSYGYSNWVFVNSNQFKFNSKCILKKIIQLRLREIPRIDSSGIAGNKTKNGWFFQLNWEKQFAYPFQEIYSTSTALSISISAMENNIDNVTQWMLSLYS
jgi:hypothetical protein